jgi:hypothetical protein
MYMKHMVFFSDTRFGDNRALSDSPICFPSLHVAESRAAWHLQGLKCVLKLFRRSFVGYDIIHKPVIINIVCSGVKPK